MDERDKELLNKTPGGRAILAAEADKIGRLTKTLQEIDREIQAKKAKGTYRMGGGFEEVDRRRARVEGLLLEAKAKR